MVVCSSRRKKYYRDYYYRNKEIRLQKGRERRQKLKDSVQDYKESHPCVDCKIFYPYYVMDFDHIKDKTERISVLVNSGQSKERILAEMDKCELVCSNCHRIRTHKRGYSNIPASKV